MSQYVKTFQPTHGLMPELTYKEKAIISLGVLGMVGWIAFGDKIKRKLKR